MMGKLIFLSTVVCIIALLLNIEYTDDLIHTFLPVVLGYVGVKSSSSTDNLKVFSKSELAQFTGKDGERIYLGLLGHVFDVTRGKKHYGPGGGYEFFSGIDGTKGFVTGDFTEEGLIDDISSLANADILGLENWISFYEKDYKLIGKVEGAFFNSEGQEIAMMKEYKRKLHLAKQEKSLVEKDRQMFPPCNSEWSQGKGGRIWCTNLSGGVKRDWVGVPRRYYTAGSSQSRCACIRTTGPPSHDPESKTHKNRGDLDNPTLSVYPNCHETSFSCPLPETK